MIGLGAKFLLTPIVGFGSLAGLISLSTQDWDPSNLWRVSAKDEFTLFTCEAKDTRGGTISPYDKPHTGKEKVRVVLKLKKVNSLAEGAELELWGIGSNGAKENLQQDKEGGYFAFSLSGETKNLSLMQGDGGDRSANIFGWDFFVCGQRIQRITEGTDSPQFELKNIGFKLKDCDSQGKECWIDFVPTPKEVKGGLKWADDFKPKVVIN